MLMVHRSEDGPGSFRFHPTDRPVKTLGWLSRGCPIPPGSATDCARVRRRPCDGIARLWATCRCSSARWIPGLGAAPGTTAPA